MPKVFKETATKVCKSCKVEKSTDEFRTTKTRKGTKIYTPRCKQCLNEQSRKPQRFDNCEECGSLFSAVALGKPKTRKLCVDCYPEYRVAYMLVATARNRANKQNLAFDIDVEYIYDLLKRGKCARTGLTFEYNNKGKNFGERHPLTPSLDKIIPSKGYVKGNVQIVCWWYNLAKAMYTDDQVLELCKAVVKQNS